MMKISDQASSSVTLNGGNTMTAASAITIDFSGLPGNNGSPFTSYTESGFAVDATSENWLVGQSFGNPPPFIDFNHPAVAGTTTTGSIEVTESGATFRMDSVDIYSSVTPVPYILTGLLHGNTVFTVNDTVPNTFGNFATIVNPDALDAVDSLQLTLSTFTEFPVSNAVGIDNLVVTPPCFARGTHIATLEGDIAIEDLREGDLVVTARGEAKPIVWIGRS